MLKVNSRRQIEEFPIGYLHEQLQEVSRLQTKSQYEPSRIPNTGVTQKEEGGERRRGEFARERGSRRGENINPNQIVQQPAKIQNQ
jgi:hypothetical protein